MTDDYTTPSPPPDDNTRAGNPTSRNRGRRELPRRGYENQPRPVNPPMPEPLTSEQQRPQRNISSAQEQSARRTSPPPDVNAPRSRKRRPSKSDSGLYLPWWSLLILILVAGVTAFAILGFVLSMGNDPLGDQPAQVVIVTNANEPTPFGAGSSSGNLPSNALVITYTPGGVPTTEPLAPTPVPSADPTETPLPGVSTGCPRNALVTVTGTGNVGLSIRSQPRQGDNINGVAFEGETLRIVGGPENSTAVDGTLLEWCQVEGVDVDTPDRNGWAARTFLAEIGFEEGE